MSSTSKKRALFVARITLVLCVVLAPWPFGSVTPRFAAALTASLTLLSGAVLAEHLASGSRLPAPPGWGVLAGGLFLALTQQLPWPRALVGLAAPGIEASYAAADAGLARESGFRPLTVELFQTRWTSLELVGFALAFYLTYVLFVRGRQRQALAYAVAAAGVALSLFAVYQKARFGTMLYGRFPTPSGTPFGPFVNHNHFAGYVEASALVTLGVGLQTARRHGSLAFLLFGASTLMGVALVLSQSRGGLLATGTGLLALFWLGRDDGNRGRAYLAAAGLGVALLLVAFAPGSLVDRWTRLADGDRSVAFRTKLWADSLRLARTSPLVGTGLGTYAAAIPPYRRGPDETRAEFAESDWIQYLCETGVLGVGLALALLVTSLRAGRRAIEEELSDRGRGLRQGAFAAVVAMGVHGLVDFNFHIPSNALLFAVLLGLLPARNEGGLAIERRGFARGAAILVLALAGALALHAFRLGESRELQRRVSPLLTDPEEFTATIQALARSREQVPSNPHTSFLLGRIYNEEAYRSRDETRYRDVRLSQASAAFRDAVALAPARGRYWFELGWTEANRGNPELADRLFPRALELEPHWANLRANYALYLIAMGRMDEAVRELEIGRELEPGLRPLDALNVIGPYVEDDEAKLRRVAGTGEEANRAIAQYRSENPTVP